MKISITLGSDSVSEQSNNKKKSIHKKPWFWLLIILIASVAVRMSSKNQPVLSTVLSSVQNDDKDVSSDAAENVPEVIENTSYEENPSENSVADDNKKSVFHFVMNTSTKKYHTTECSAVKKLTEEKRLDTDIEAGSLNDAKQIIENEGYTICGICDR